MPLVDDISRIHHIIEASERALEFIRGRKSSDLDEDVMLGLALVRHWKLSDRPPGEYLKDCAPGTRKLPGVT